MTLIISNFKQRSGVVKIRLSQMVNFRLTLPFFDSHQVDGNDVLEVYEAAKRAIDQCREGNGPVFIECLTYRFRGHVGPDDNIQGTHTDIRPREEMEAWLKKDPICRLERQILAGRGQIFTIDILVC